MTTKGYFTNVISRTLILLTIQDILLPLNPQVFQKQRFWQRFQNLSQGTLRS
jgi:hypothetical protein